MWCKMKDWSRVSQDMQLLSVIKMVINVQGREFAERSSKSKLSEEAHEPLREVS